MRISSRKNNKIKFNTSHTNYENKNGDYVPSVTTILKILSKGDALAIWANNLGWKRKSYKKELEDSSTIGTIAHAFCEYILQKDDKILDEINKQMEELSDNVYTQTKNAILSFKKWYNDHKDDIEVTAIELQLVCDKYGGTADLVCKYKGKRMIFDFKTSSSFYMTQFLQLSSYAKMYKKIYDKKIDDVAILRLDKKNGDKAQLLRLSKLPNGNLKYYQHVFDKLYDLYKFNYVLSNDWDYYNKIISQHEILE